MVVLPATFAAVERSAHAQRAARQAVASLADLQVIAVVGFASVPTPAVPATIIPPPAEYLAQARAIAASQRRINRIAVMVIIALLIVAGLQALYVGKTFGTFWDFAAALAWRAAAGAAVTPLTAAIEGLAAARS